MVACTPSGSAASILIHTALPPFAVIPAVTSSARLPLRSAITTDAPSCTKRRAVAAPMPDPPAVTIATLPSSFPDIYAPEKGVRGWGLGVGEDGKEYGRPI